MHEQSMQKEEACVFTAKMRAALSYTAAAVYR
jgi:hypothetical protein